MRRTAAVISFLCQALLVWPHVVEGLLVGGRATSSENDPRLALHGQRLAARSAGHSVAAASGAPGAADDAQIGQIRSVVSLAAESLRQLANETVSLLPPPSRGPDDGPAGSLRWLDTEAHAPGRSEGVLLQVSSSSSVASTAKAKDHGIGEEVGVQEEWHASRRYYPLACLILVVAGPGLAIMGISATCDWPRKL
eukprot:TRINITY_DN36565_c0_g1_i1.p1 TRINITY_DN36565_c0_g1~~TRINITY_DN36565_c0_g1_i1.p1  ORF type:complete len:195 (+),score=15.30 TRINITY_DN36565_c0_g1_i1:75-659(+)